MNVHLTAASKEHRILFEGLSKLFYLEYFQNIVRIKMNTNYFEHPQSSFNISNKKKITSKVTSIAFGMSNSHKCCDGPSEVLHRWQNKRIVFLTTTEISPNIIQLQEKPSITTNSAGLSRCFFCAAAAQRGHFCP